MGKRRFYFLSRADRARATLIIPKPKARLKYYMSNRGSRTISQYIFKLYQANKLLVKIGSILLL